MILLDEPTKQVLKAMQRKTKDRKVFVRATVLLLLGKGRSAEIIAEDLGIDEGTVYRYKQKYEKEGFESYFKDNWVGYSGQLTELEKGILEQELDRELHISSASVALFIEEQFGIRYSTNGVTKLLKKLGFVYKKTKLVPSKANRAAQEAFQQKIAHLLENPVENVQIFYNDAVHPQHNTRPERGWIRKGTDFEISSNSGKNRINLNGAVNAHQPTEIIVQEQKTINSQSTIELWEAINLKYPDKDCKIIHICDNASYYHSKIITDWLILNPRVEVIYLPSYSPNLNLIERLWKFLRKEVINSIYRVLFKDFRFAILDFFENIAQHKKALESLLTLNFRITSC